MEPRAASAGPGASLLALGASLGALACAPVADFRPPSALVRGNQTFEVGGGGVYVSPRPYVVESGHGSGQLWFTGRAARWLSLSLVSAFDRHSALGGAQALARFVTTDRAVAAVGVEAGFAWGGASLEGAARLFDDTWIYAAPRVFNWGKFVAVGVPVGLSLHVVGGLSVRGEAQVSWEDLQYYNRRLHVGAAAAYEW